jgi:porin
VADSALHSSNVSNPGAGLANPNDSAKKIKNELVIGLRTNITF